MVGPFRSRVIGYRLFTAQMERVGVQSAPLIFLVSALIGVILVLIASIRQIVSSFKLSAVLKYTPAQWSDQPGVVAAPPPCIRPSRGFMSMRSRRPAA